MNSDQSLYAGRSKKSDIKCVYCIGEQFLNYFINLSEYKRVYTYGTIICLYIEVQFVQNEVYF